MATSRTGGGRLAAALLAVAVAATGFVVAGSPAYAAGLPTVTGLTVTKGSTAGGTTLIVTGTNFDTVDDSDVNNVTFGGTAVQSLMVLSATQLSVKSPVKTAGVVDVKVTNPSGTSVASTGGKFTYREPLTAAVPANTLLNPIAGSVITVTVTGLTLSSTTFAAEKITATVGGVSATVVYASSSTVKVTAPAGTPSNTAVAVALIHDTVTGTADSTNAKYASVISKLSVTSGPKAGTTGTAQAPALTITGKGLTGATLFKLGGEDLTCTVSNDTTAKCESVVPQDTPIVGPFLVTYTPANSIPRGTTAGAVYTFTDVS